MEALFELESIFQLQIQEGIGRNRPRICLTAWPRGAMQVVLYRRRTDPSSDRRLDNRPLDSLGMCDHTDFVDISR